ncbi:hypothetical protein RF55_1983 [Lasius niger]|uniref:Uncharacterized protein n=1 Tax=Lasius niger TaxID=67767 RepID=A0A0J7NZ80_LASNI|nr:hypothetical protein RF55_1983 [Lasius niger]
MQDRGQQVADVLVEVEELVGDELELVAQETETDAGPAAEGAEVDDEVAAAVAADDDDADDFQVCVDGHQPESEPGPGPGFRHSPISCASFGPSLGPFCSDILS